MDGLGKWAEWKCALAVVTREWLLPAVNASKRESLSRRDTNVDCDESIQQMQLKMVYAEAKSFSTSMTLKCIRTNVARKYLSECPMEVEVGELQDEDCFDNMKIASESERRVGAEKLYW